MRLALLRHIKEHPEQDKLAGRYMVPDTSILKETQHWNQKTEENGLLCRIMPSDSMCISSPTS